MISGLNIFHRVFCQWPKLEESLERIEPDTLRAPFVPPTSHAEAMANEDGYEQGLLELGDIGCGLVNFLVVSGVEYGHTWHGWSGLPLPATPLDGEMEALWNKSGQDEKPGRYRRWVDAVLAPTNRERLTFLPWYEDNLDRAIKQCSAG